MKLKTYWQNFIHAGRDEHDTEFLPAILEVTETPPSPVGRLVLYSVILLLTALLFWSIVGHIDETAVAEGKVIPSGQMKTVQVKNKSIVREIKVKEGDFVHEGDVLVVLDPTATDADYDSLNKRAAYYALDIKRLEAELSGNSFEPGYDDILSESDILAERRLYESRQGQYRAEHEAAVQTVAQRQAAMEAAQAGFEKYDGMYQIARDKEERLAELEKQEAISEFQLLEQRSQRIELEKNRQSQMELLHQGSAELSEAREKLRNMEAAYKKDIMTALVESRKQYYMLEEEIKKADENSRMATITAPCDGRIYNLSIHTVGAIVTDAQALLMIVPDDVPLEFEVWADNKDIGFIKTGQKAEVKVETFNFQKFGTVEAEVAEISPNASGDEKSVSTYEKYRLLLHPKAAEPGSLGVESSIAPGMNVTAEIKIKQKRIIEFFLDPFRKYTSEALRER